jgi:hypothetical protein
MATLSNSTRAQDLAVLIVFWLVAVVLLREVAGPRGSVHGLFAILVAGLVLAIGAFAIAVRSLRARFVGTMARPLQIVYGVLVFVAVGVFFFGGAVLLARLLVY